MTFLCLLFYYSINWYLYTLYNNARFITSSTIKRFEAMALAFFKVRSYRYTHSWCWYAIHCRGKVLQLMCRPIQSRKSTYDGGLLEGTDGTGRTGSIGKPSCFEAVSWPPLGDAKADGRYQFNPQMSNPEIIVNILTQALSSTVHGPDFNLCLSLLREPSVRHLC